MAETVSKLRKIVLDVKPPRILIDRLTEIPIMSDGLVDRLVKATTREEGIAISEDVKKEQAPEADEVFPNIFIGNYKAVNTVSFLKNLGITNIFNAAEGDGPGMVPKLNPENLDGIRYDAMLIRDNVDANDNGEQIELFKKAAAILNDIKKQPNTKLLVNCFGGHSRSTCCVLTYLICYQGMTASEALTTVKEKRDVWPSKQNLAHIARLSNEIHGYKDVEVVDMDVAVTDFRKITRRPTTN